jgi:tetratricopeptide (TPR) repeat protein/transcriptional regulator with XRE-family HTH domain
MLCGCAAIVHEVCRHCIEGKTTVDNEDTFADLLGRYRARAGLTQQELANEIGVHRNTVAKWENRTSLKPDSRGQVLRLTKALSLSKGECKAFIQATGFSVERWPTEVFVVPQQRDMFFTGRDDVLEVLRHLLVPGSTAALTQAISGLGGIGKTDAAAEYAYRFHEDYEAVLWLPADSWETLTLACGALADELGLPEREDANEVVGEVRRWLRKNRHWLLILDDVENPQEILPKFVPTEHQGSILITTRVQDVEPLAQTKRLETLSEQESVLFLLRRTKKVAHETKSMAQVSGTLYAEAQPIYKLLDGLPLALDQAGAYILETHRSFAAYDEQYRHRRVELLQRRGKRFIGHEMSIAATFSLAFERVEVLNPLAADVLRICSFLHHEAIPEEFFEIGALHLGTRVATGKESIPLALGTLLDYSLISCSPDTKTVTLHRVVQAVLQDNLTGQERKEWTERVIVAMDAVFPHNMEHTSWTQCERYVAHALACAAAIGQEHLARLEGASLLKRLGWYLRDRARYEEAERVLKRALVIQEKILGSGHRTTSQSLNELAHLCYKRGNLEEAEALYERALAIHEGQPVLVASEMVTALNNLADTCRAEGKDEKALTLFQRALTICDLYGGEHLGTALVLSNLGLLYVAQRKYEEAKPLLWRALSIREKLLGSDSPDVATIFINLGKLSFDQGEYEQAEQLYQQGLKIDMTVYGDRHPEVATDLAALADLYLEIGKYTRAEPLLQQALEIREELLGPRHVHTADILNLLGWVYQMQRKYEKAQLYLQRALTIREEQLGQEHWDTAVSLNNLGFLYLEQGSYEQAASLLQQALAIKNLLDPQHHSTAQSLDNLGGVYYKQEKYEEAELLLWRALFIREKQLGLSHPKTAESLNNLALLCTALGKYEQAESLYRRALTICEQRGEWDHSRTLLCLHNLVEMYETQEKFGDAEVLLVDALKVQEQQLGPNHPCTVFNLDDLARIYTEHRRYTEAEPLYLRAIAICQAEPSLADVLKMVQTNYANLLRKTGRAAEAALLETPDQHDNE